MDLLNLLIKPVNYICLLCFKESSNMSDVYMKMEIEENFFRATLKLADMIKYLFPYFEISLPQACDKCSKLILKMYISIRRNILIKKIISTIIDSLNNALNITNIENSLNCYLNINLSKMLDIKNENVPKKEEINNEIIEDEREDYEEKQCQQCFKIFKSGKVYKKHVRDHCYKRVRKYYNCNNCSYKSLCRTSLQGHINKFHLKSRPHVCEICYKSFYHKKNLIVHVESHSEKRNEICEICGNRFIHKKNLLEHLNLHSGVRPFECNICSKRFITSGRRLEHIKRIHNEKTECCLLCDKKFGLSKELKRHMKTVHSSL